MAWMYIFLFVFFSNVSVGSPTYYTLSNPGCATSCHNKKDGFYASCLTCSDFIRCKATSYTSTKCPVNQEWDIRLIRCVKGESSTCHLRRPDTVKGHLSGSRQRISIALGAALCASLLLVIGVSILRRLIYAKPLLDSNNISPFARFHQQLTWCCNSDPPSYEEAVQTLPVVDVETNMQNLEYDNIMDNVENMGQISDREIRENNEQQADDDQLLDVTIEPIRTDSRDISDTVLITENDEQQTDDDQLLDVTIEAIRTDSRDILDI